MNEQPVRRGPWTIMASREVYRDPWISVRRDEVIRPDGQPGSHCVVHVKEGVSVVALDEEDHVYLAEEFHYAIGRVALEVVSGGGEEGEPPLLTAQRELAEELGIVAETWTDLGMVDPFTSVVLSPTRLYLAERLTFRSPDPEATESIRAIRLPLDEAVRRVLASQITHAPSCALLLKAYLHLRGLAPPEVDS